ncbi:hypothetical protein Ae168Ps1_0263 [Pseudonocardia sp. Ae168_Ps1]|nr:hypothetical protein Ae168Ps1_0263 [Pseudonocardia sp. Ae168_Ps1]OLL91955.1 hypothetical protein Ae356Ps1_1852 [Pseudonocardia sp. Ae356_Ps1]
MAGHRRLEEAVQPIGVGRSGRSRACLGARPGRGQRQGHSPWGSCRGALRSRGRGAPGTSVWKPDRVRPTAFEVTYLNHVA